jgi:hypothetical protein
MRSEAVAGFWKPWRWRFFLHIKGQMQHGRLTSGFGNQDVKDSIRDFFWLLLNDRLNTRNKRLKHLFFECEFAQCYWTSLHIVWDLTLVVDEMIAASEQTTIQEQLLYGSPHSGSLGHLDSQK